MLSLKNGKIVAEWSTMLPGCQGEGPGLLEAIEAKLAASDAPSLEWKQESASTSFMKGMLGKRRNVLVVRNLQFSEWLVCVGAQDYGRFLNVVWYLTAAPKFANKIRSAAAGEAIVDALDVFDQQDVNAYAAVTRMAVVSATEEFAQRREIDFARLNRQLRGLRATG